MDHNTQKYSIPELISLSNDFSSLCKRTQETLNAIHQQAASLELYWQGDAANAYQEQMRNLQSSDANTAVVDLSGIARKVMEVANIRAGMDNQIGGLIDDLPTGLVVNTVATLL